MLLRNSQQASNDQPSQQDNQGVTFSENHPGIARRGRGGIRRNNTRNSSTSPLGKGQQNQIITKRATETGAVVQEVQRDIDVFAELSQSSDELGNALKNVREIPLEQYLS